MEGLVRVHATCATPIADMPEEDLWATHLAP